MPRAKDWRVYPPNFGDFISEAAVRELLIPCESEKAAKSLQGMLYAYHGALKAAAEAGDPEAKVLNSIRLRVQYRQEGSFVRAFPREFSPQAKAIQSALAALGQAHPVDPADHQPSADFLELLKKAKAEGEETPDE